MHRPIDPLMCLFAVAIILAGTPARSGDPADPVEVSISEIAGLIEKLEDPVFAVREAASRQLLEKGAATISALVETGLTGPPEAATRALNVLEGHLLSDDKTTYEAADDALQRLADSQNGVVSVGAGGILQRHGRLRETRAVAMIREMGGTVTYDVDQPDESQWQGQAIWAPREPNEARSLRPRDIVIGSDWTGGTEGLKYLRRLSHWRDLRLYVVRASGVPFSEAEKLAAVLPGLTVQERGAYLGIQNSPYSNTELCVVGEVIVDGPAGLAGLKERDIIREFNGEPVGGFDDLIEKLKDRLPGESVTMTIDRHDFQTDKRERLNVEVNLGKWDLPNFTPRAEHLLKKAANAKAERERQMRDEPAVEPVPTEAYPLFER